MSYNTHRHYTDTSPLVGVSYNTHTPPPLLALASPPASPPHRAPVAALASVLAPPFLRHYTDGGFPAVDNSLLLFWMVLKWVGYPQLSTVIHSYPQVIRTNTCTVIQGLSTERRSYPQKRYGADGRCLHTQTRTKASRSLLLRGRHGHANCHHTWRQGLAWQQPSGSLHSLAC